MGFPKQHAWRGLAAALLVLHLAPGAAAQDPLRDAAGLPLARHVRGKSEQPLLPPASAAAESDLAAFVYPSLKTTLPSGAGTFDVKPACTVSEVRRFLVEQDHKALDGFDIVYYDERSAAQARRASSVKAAEPYQPGDLTNPHRRRRGLRQELARLLGIRCLPTRVRFIIIRDRRYEEHREGERAWDALP